MLSLISVIVPCYNQAQYLDECLQSVFDQTYQNWECLIINDGSPDNTAEVAQLWLAKDSRFKYFYKENGGLSSARNYGIDKSEGEWIQFLDCDDLLEKEKFKLQSQFFATDIDILVSGYRYFEDTEGKEKKRIFGRDNFLPEVCLDIYDVDIIELLSRKNPFVISAPLYSKKVFENIGGFNINLFSLEDWEFNLRCALNNYKIHHTGYGADSKTLIRLHDNSLMRNEEKMIKNYHTFVEICNSNPLYVKKVGLRDLPVEKKISFYFSLFIPPVFFIVLNKMRNNAKR